MSENPIEIAAKALRKEADEFRDPVSSYVEGEALERAGLWQDGQAARLQKDWELESWKILARAVIAALEGAGVILKWRPIETAPKDGQEMLLRLSWGVRIGSWSPYMDAVHSSHWHDQDGDALARSWKDDAEPTHWTPLPSAPTYTPPAEERK